MGNQQICTPSGSQFFFNQMSGTQASPAAADAERMIPPQIKKYISHPVDQAIENPNVIKIEKAKLAEKIKTPEQALHDVLIGLLPNFDVNADLFEQGLSSLDTVKIVTRCAEAGYEIDMKDIYMHSTFAELVKCMK